MIMVDEEFNIAWANDIAKEMLGPDMVGMKCYRSYHERNEVCDPCIVKLCFEDGMVHEFETEIFGADGNKLSFWCKASIAERYEDGRPKMVVEFLRDITERKQAGERIRASLKEKEVLLAEVHHRVKNNFQVISSLLDMIRMRTQNQEAIDLLTDARSKIYTMALVHAQLYEQKRFDQIELASHVRKLAEHLRQVYSSKGPTIGLVLEPSDVYLTLNQAIPCALVMNEVLSNAFRHAFKEAQQGTVEVSISKSDDDMVLIRVKDGGIGIPEEMDIDKAKTLGLKLVKNIVGSQLKGRVQVSRDNGTEVIIAFKALPEGGSHA
jgi:PAS domain S-box-containing protein